MMRERDEKEKSLKRMEEDVELDYLPTKQQKEKKDWMSVNVRTPKSGKRPQSAYGPGKMKTPKGLAKDKIKAGL